MSKETQIPNIPLSHLSNEQDTAIRWIRDHIQQPLLGYMLHHGDLYLYGLVDRSVLQTGMINPMGACESPETAHNRVRELLELALEQGATVMGTNGIPEVIDLSPESGGSTSKPR